MHEFDPNGSLREYRMRRARNEIVRDLIVGAGCMGLVLVCFWLINVYCTVGPR